MFAATFYLCQYLRDRCVAREAKKAMPKHEYAAYPDDIELGESPSATSDSAKRKHSSSWPFRASKLEGEDKSKVQPTAAHVDIWSEIACEDPPTYQDHPIVPQSRPIQVRNQSPPKRCPGDIHISYCHYVALVFTIICLSILIIFHTIFLLYRAHTTVAIAGLSTAATSVASACPTSAPQINVEPHFVVGTDQDEAVNTTTIMVYQTFTETTTAISTVLSTLNTPSTRSQDSSATVQGNISASTATTTLVSAITLFTTITLTPSLRTPSTVTMTSTEYNCSALSSAPPLLATTMTTSVKAAEQSIKPSTRYFTGPNKVGSIMGGP